MLFRQERNSCHVDSGRDKAEEKLGVENVTHLREVDHFVLSLPSCTPGLTYRYPSCESVTDEYAGHVIQVLQQEGGNGELIMDQYASRLAYRSVKSGVQEAARTVKVKYSSKMFPLHNSSVKINKELLKFSNKEGHQEVDKKRQRKRSGSHLCKYQACERTQEPCRNELSELYSFSASLASIITRDVKKQLTAPTVDLPQSSTDSYLFEKSGCVDRGESTVEPEFSKSHQSLQNHGFCQNTGSLSGRALRENVQAVEQYARKVVDDTLELSLGPTVSHIPEPTASADRIPYAEKLSPLMNGACRYCDLKELHGCGRSPSQLPLKQSVCVSAKPGSHSKLSSVHQKSSIFHLDVPRIRVNLDKRAVLAEKIVAAAIEKAERELSSTSLAADSGIGQDGISFAESLTTEIMTSAMTNAEHVASSSKEIEDFQTTESFGSQQLNLSVGEDSTGSWSNLSFEDDHQDESSSFHHLSESDGPDDRDDDQEDGVEGLQQNGRTLLITNIDMELGAVDPQLRIILQWLVASEADVAELYFHDSSKKEFVLLSKQLQEKGWRVGNVLQAVFKYYEVLEKTASEERCKPLFDWLLENA
ncbi:hypothetical protein STEG23_032397 [Scotinomys teguina]